MLILKIFLLILLTSVAGIVVELVGSSPADGLTESNSSALKNGTIVTVTIVPSETIRPPPNHSAAETKIPILNRVISAGPVRGNTTAMVPKTPIVNQGLDDNNVYLTNATIALVIVTAILVGATWYYAIQTRNTVNEMKRATGLQFIPSLVSNFTTGTDGELSVFVKNIGVGPAKQITVRISSVGRITREEVYHTSLIEPEKEEYYSIDAGYPKTDRGYDKVGIYNFYKKNKTILTVKVDYIDILEKKYEAEQIIDVTNDIKPPPQY